MNKIFKFKFALLTIICCFIGLFSIAHAATMAISRTYVTVTNNTPTTIGIQSKLVTQDSHFVQGKDWDSTISTLAPYETKQIIWFNRNPQTKNPLQFDMIANPPSFSHTPIKITFFEKAKSTYGSELTTSVTFPEQASQSILRKNGLEQYSGNWWGNDNKFYARKWLPSGKLFTNYHFVIDQTENNAFDTSTKQTLSVLTYNTQMMPFYANVVDDLNQPQTRVKNIPQKISSYDVVILEELLDHNLREKMIAGMQIFYPYHTKVISQKSSSKILTGGVMIFSKWPIVKEDQIVYQASAGADSLAAKGAVYAAINKQGKIYHLIGTHLQAENGEKDILARQKQLQELTNFIDRLAIPTSEPLLMGGDFNIDQFGNEINNLTGILGVNSLQNIGYVYSFDGEMDTMAVNKNRIRIDYVFYHNSHLKPSMALNKVFILRDFDHETMWPKFDLSDHFPVASFFEFPE